MGSQGYITAETTAGRVRGMRHNGVDSYLGVPYGAPSRRWLPGEPAATWDGVLDCLQFGPVAPQIDGRVDATGSWPQVADLMYPLNGSPIEGGRIGEDCLVLNVWSPAEASGAPLPVMVWLHGGGFGHGAGSEMIFSGDEIARTGRAVVVTVNHRLGILGHLFLGAQLGAEYATSGQVGITDLVLALEWVRDNIAGFGGDPAAVTIFGQSGGGAKVTSLLGMPSAQGLFHRAIIQSGAIQWFATPERAAEITATVLEQSGLEPKDLLDLPLHRLLDVQHLAEASGVMWGPSIDGTVVPVGPFADGGTDLMADIPLLIGSTTQEMSLMLVSEPGYDTLDDAGLLDAVTASHGDEASSTIERYRTQYPDDNASLLLARISSDLTFTRSAVRGASIKSGQPAPVYAYRFAYETEVHHGTLGAAHSLDLAFVFGTVARSPFTGDRVERHEVSRRMRDAWIAFAESGTPRADGTPDWPRYDDVSRATMVIDTEWSVTTGYTIGELARPEQAGPWIDG